MHDEHCSAGEQRVKCTSTGVHTKGDPYLRGGSRLDPRNLHAMLWQGPACSRLVITVSQLPLHACEL